MSYLTREFLEFFAELERNNRREWYHENKRRYYAHVKEPFEELVGELIFRIGKQDPEIAIEPREAIFRLARDTRFSRDKTPYKTHASAVISPGGRKHEGPGMYVQLSARGVDIGGGVYRPGTAEIRKIRGAIRREGDILAQALRAGAFRQLFGGELKGEKYKRLPKEDAELTDRYPFIGNRQFFYYVEYGDPKLILRDDLTDFIMRHYEAGKEVNAFLSRALKGRASAS